MTDTFRIARSTFIEAPPEAVFPLVNDFRQWAKWSPFESLDADLQRDFSGSDRGVGSTYAWNGRKAGAGRMEIRMSEPPRRILIRLDFTCPFPAHNTAEFFFEGEGSGVRVTWTMTGPHTVMSKLMGLFFSMEKMVGPQFESGLAAMKAVAEGARQPA